MPSAAAAECRGEGTAGTVVESLEPDASSVAVLLVRRREGARPCGTGGGPIGNGETVSTAIIFDEPIAGGSCSSGGSRSDDECLDVPGEARRDGVSRGEAGLDSESPEYVRAGLPAVANVRMVNVPAGDPRAPSRPLALDPGPTSACDDATARPLPLTSTNGAGGLKCAPPATASSDSRKSCSETDALRPPPIDDGESRSGIELVDGVGSDPHVSDGEPGSVQSSDGSGEPASAPVISSLSPAAASLLERSYEAGASMHACAGPLTTAGVDADADVAS